MEDSLRRANLLVSQLKETGRLLGEGSYGEVVEVKVGGKLYAGKRLHAFFYRRDVPPREAEAMSKRFEEECLRMPRLKHRNIVEVLGVYVNPASRQPTLVMELLHISLSRYLETHPATPPHVKYSLLLDVCRGLAYLHDRSIIHRDLTANNVLLTVDTTAKIADFGQARILDKNPAQLARSNPWSRVPGNTAHMPPEAFLDKPQYDTKLDVFSFGVVMLHTLNQEWPEPSSDKVPALNEPGGFRLVNEVERRKPHIDRIDNPLLKSLVIQCLNRIPDLRPSASELVRGVEMVRQQISAPSPKSDPPHFTHSALGQHNSQKKEASGTDVDPHQYKVQDLEKGAKSKLVSKLPSVHVPLRIHRGQLRHGQQKHNHQQRGSEEESATLAQVMGVGQTKLLQENREALEEIAQRKRQQELDQVKQALPDQSLNVRRQEKILRQISEERSREAERERGRGQGAEGQKQPQKPQHIYDTADDVLQGNPQRGHVRHGQQPHNRHQLQPGQHLFDQQQPGHQPAGQYQYD